MTFHPRMQNRIDGISDVRDLRWRAWSGAIADVWDVTCAPEAHGEYISQAPRLVMVLDHAGDDDASMDLALSPECRGCPLAQLRGTMCYVPAGVRTWATVENARSLKHLDIHLDIPALQKRFSCCLARDAVATPRLAFADARVAGIARLIAAECEQPDPSPDLYGDALVSGLVAALFQTCPKAGRKRGELPPCLVRRVTDFLADNCTRNIRLAELADITGLSQTYVCSAFKAATGLPPHKWQMRARVEKAKALLEARETSLAEAAADLGFADQAHLTRVFRQVVGTTPAAWLRERRA
jgi:AraC family transcriptional regulator